MKKYLTIVAALLMLNTASALAQTETKTADSTAVKCGETVTITATADDGYEFEKWQDGNTSNPREITITSETDVWAYVATFKAISYTITVAVKDAGTGSVETSSFTGNKGDKIKLKAIESETCYEFSHWEDSEGTQLSDSKEYEYEINGTTTVYAVFTEKDFTVKVTSGGNGSVTIAKKQP